MPSPLPGIFYRRPSPEEDEYVQVGERVTKGQTLGLIEVMKNFTEFTAPEDGTIEEFLVENEEEVSVGQDIVRLG
ncbi:MAG TPA: acetyl-CoA carboxylase [Salinisphaeraceae bacterium]|nr:acetyl-CoA carboxylase [Salinisphaeraceae bacterium]